MGETGEMLGSMSVHDALQLSQEAGKDLVLITDKSTPPVVKIINLAKFRYQQQQKKSENRKKAKKQDIKGVRLTPFIGEADFQNRLKRIHEFLEKGHKVRIEVDFRKGRQITKTEFGYQHFDRIFAATNQIAEVELPPKQTGKKIMAQLTPSKKKKTAEENDEKV